VPRSKNAWSYTSTPSIHLDGVVLSYSTRTTTTIIIIIIIIIITVCNIFKVANSKQL
jgi:hypothetical protein